MKIRKNAFATLVLVFFCQSKFSRKTLKIIIKKTNTTVKFRDVFRFRKNFCEIFNFRKNFAKISRKFCENYRDKRKIIAKRDFAKNFHDFRILAKIETSTLLTSCPPLKYMMCRLAPAYSILMWQAWGIT
jgi:3'-phosphoadenosine 5'-phosphosulfate sulfotransferase (PAPS reductase)/FAD synthetase